VKLGPGHRNQVPTLLIPRDSWNAKLIAHGNLHHRPGQVRWLAGRRTPIRGRRLRLRSHRRFVLDCRPWRFRPAPRRVRSDLHLHRALGFPGPVRTDVPRGVGLIGVFSSIPGHHHRGRRRRSPAAWQVAHSPALGRNRGVPAVDRRSHTGVRRWKSTPRNSSLSRGFPRLPGRNQSA